MWCCASNKLASLSGLVRPRPLHRVVGVWGSMWTFLWRFHSTARDSQSFLALNYVLNKTNSHERWTHWGSQVWFETCVSTKLMASLSFFFTQLRVLSLRLKGAWKWVSKSFRHPCYSLFSPLFPFIFWDKWGEDKQYCRPTISKLQMWVQSSKLDLCTETKKVPQQLSLETSSSLWITLHSPINIFCSLWKMFISCQTS